MSITFFRPGMNANGQPETDPSGPPPPAAPFPQEPGDVPAGQPEPAQQPPEPQQDDPGAEPPPANLEQMSSELVRLIDRTSRIDRNTIKVLTEALINQLSTTLCAIRMTRDSISRLGPDEVHPMLLLRSLHEEAEALTIMLLPYTESRPASVN